LFVNDISLSQVTDDFICYIEEQEEFPIGTSTEFLSIAATLMLLKSASLLPTMDLSEEEEGDIETLQHRLQVYQRVKEMSSEIWQRWGTQRAYAPARKRDPTPMFSPTNELITDAIRSAMRQLIEQTATPDEIPQTEIRERVSLTQTIETLRERLQHALQTRFSEVSGYRRGGQHSREERHAIVINFLALLELVKSGSVDVEQSDRYDDITLALLREHNNV
jgi:segregation and condensation protein A